MCVCALLKMTPEEEAAIKDPVMSKYDEEGHPYFSSARLWDDGIIDPKDTRSILALSLSACFNREFGADPARYGIFRM